jgi:hypothetical protein
LTAHLANLSSESYFGTPGSVTAGLRETASTINDHLMDANQGELSESKLQGHSVVAVLRGKDLYVSQCGQGQVILVRHDLVSVLSSEGASDRPLGLSSSIRVRFYHFEVQPQDLLILTTTDPPVWSETSLSKLLGLNPAQAVDRLSENLTQDLIGMVIGIAGPGTEIRSPVEKHQPVEGSPLRAQTVRTKELETEVTPLAKPPSRFRISFSRLRGRIRSFFGRVRYAIAHTVARLTPGLAEPPEDAYSSKVHAATALVVPLVVVFIASIIYFQRGRGEQFQLNIADAHASIALAESKPDQADAREDWEVAKFWLDKAVKYGTSEELTNLSEKVQEALDRLDLITRLEFSPVVSGGFGPDASIRSLAATSTDLYVLDGKNGSLWHLWATGQGYDIDGDFECLDGEVTLSSPVDIGIVPPPSALNAESILVIGDDGSLVYCAPDRIPISGVLSPPASGWGQIEGFQIFGNFLYLLDKSRNAVWIYNAADGIVSGTPSQYFVEQVPDLGEAIDIAVTEEGLYILFTDGSLDLCHRVPGGGEAEGQDLCEDVRFNDERTGFGETDQIPDASPAAILYSPPPEPSLFILDPLSGGTYQYSMRVIYQARILPLQPFADGLTAMTIGPPNNIFIASGTQVYHALVNR